VTWPPDDSSHLIAAAYELRGKEGSALLSGMGLFDLWRGNLAAMRGDSPTAPVTKVGEAGDADRFLQALAVSRSFEYLPPRCEAVIRLVYFEGRDTLQVAQELETTFRYAEKLVDTCTRRLFEISENVYRELVQPPDEPMSNEERAEPPAIPPSARSDDDRIQTYRK
jgi:hypothetical protein